MLAIDFGTSRIKLAYLDSISGEAKMMQLNQGNDPSEPSLFYMGPDGEREYGHFAEEYLETDPKGVVDTLKRKLRKPHIRANRQKATPLELLTHMFSDLRRRATDELPHLLGKAPKDVVLTFPARFGPAEEDILRESAKAAGFTEVILVSEPEAAARAWARGQHTPAPVMVVLDCGGGTVDWAALELRDGRYQLLANCPAGGDDKVGGHDIDQELFEELRDQVADHEEAADDLESRPSYFLTHLRRLKERFARKNKLGRRDQIKVKGTVIDLDEETIRNAFKVRYIDQLFKGFKPYIDTVKAQADGKEVQVLLVGGSSRIPGLKEAVEARCGCTAIRWDRAEYATVLGATYPEIEPPKPPPEPKASTPPKVQAKHSREPLTGQSKKRTKAAPPKVSGKYSREVTGRRSGTKDSKAKATAKRLRNAQEHVGPKPPQIVAVEQTPQAAQATEPRAQPDMANNDVGGHLMAAGSGIVDFLNTTADTFVDGINNAKSTPKKTTSQTPKLQHNPKPTKASVKPPSRSPAKLPTTNNRGEQLYTITLESVGSNLQAVTRVTRNAGRLDHFGATRLMKELPVTVRHSVTLQIAEHFKQKFAEAGATASIKPME